MRAYETTALMPCDWCGTDSETTVITTPLASDSATQEWSCPICGFGHHIELLEGDDN